MFNGKNWTLAGHRICVCSAQNGCLFLVDLGIANDAQRCHLDNRWLVHRFLPGSFECSLNYLVNYVKSHSETHKAVGGHGKLILLANSPITIPNFGMNVIFIN